jgi:hypothetical protein
VSGNAYDDIAPLSAVSGGAPSAANAYDDIVPPPPKPKVPPPAGAEAMQDPLTHSAAMIGRAAVHAVTALPMMAEDFGIGLRNLGSGLTGGSYHEYDYPSDTVNQALDQYLGKPQGTAEKIEDVAAPAALSIAAGTAAAASSAPKIAAVFGGALPKLGTAGAGTAGEIAPAVANTATRAQMTAALLKRSQDAGYVIPPSSVNPSFVNTTAETIAGKAATQQAASLKNQAVTDRLAAAANGLNPNAPLTSGALAAVRREANDSYKAVAKIGSVPTDDQYLSAVANVQSPFLQTIKDFPGTAAHPIIKEADTLVQPSFSAQAALTKIQSLRDSASAAYNSGDAQGGAAYKQLAKALEDQLDRVAGAKAAAGEVPANLVQDFRAARQTQAIAHSTEDALNDSTGHVSAAMLAKMLANGDPLSGNLRDIAQFGASFPKAVQLPEKIGSSISHLDAYGGLGIGALAEHATGSPWGLAAAAALPAARAGAKAFVLGPAQRGLTTASAPAVVGSPAKAAAIAQGLARLKDRDSPLMGSAAPAY